MNDTKWRYLHCPDCGLKGVILRRRPAGGRTHWGCRYCMWYAFLEPNGFHHRFNRRRLADANPGERV